MNLAGGNPVAAACAVTLKRAPLAVPLSLEVADLAAVDTIAAATRSWIGAAGSGPDLRIQVELSAMLSGTGATAIQVSGSIVEIRGSGAAARADLDRGVARARVSGDYLDDPRAMFLEILEPLALMLLSRRDRTPLHASGFIIEDLAVLLAGRTGAGKSCLARAADLAGLQVLSDDTVFVQLAPRLTIWGWPTSAHLLAADAPDPAAPTRSRNGKIKHVVPLRSGSASAIACHRAVLCLLTHASEAEPNLVRITGPAAKARLWPLDEGYDLLPGPIARAVARLSSAGAWDLRLGKNPADAVSLLRENIAQLWQTAAR